MKKLNGHNYFEKKDVFSISDKLLSSLSDREFVQKQSNKDRIHIERAIKTLRDEIIFVLSTEYAVKYDYIETLYTQFMHPAINILSPEVYKQKPYHDITQTDMLKCENWYFNYGLTLIVSEFEKI